MSAELELDSTMDIWMTRGRWITATAVQTQSLRSFCEPLECPSVHDYCQRSFTFILSKEEVD